MDSYLLRTSEQSSSTCQENRRNGSRFDSLALLLIRLFLCLFISRLFHLQIDSRHQRVKSHQGRSSFSLTEDQLRDPVSCRLALFRALQKIWLNGEGVFSGVILRGEELLRRLRNCLVWITYMCHCQLPYLIRNQMHRIRQRQLLNMIQIQKH